MAPGVRFEICLISTAVLSECRSEHCSSNTMELEYHGT